ncbi:MAG: hypothetical protein ACJ767_00095 [Chloroflexota bacterium]
MSDREIDRLLAGKPLEGEATDELADFVGEVRAAYVVPPETAIESRHVVAMAEVARVAADRDIAVRAEVPSRRRTLAFKEALMTRSHTATTAVKLAALSIVAALATGGLAAAGAIELPNPLPDQASDQAKAVHEAIQGSDPAAEHQTAGTEAQEEHGKLESSEDVEAQSEGADPQGGAGQAFGDSVSDRASGGEPTENGREFGESVSDEAQQLVPRPEPQAQGGPETGEENAQEQETPEPQGSRETGDEAAGTHVPER